MPAYAEKGFTLVEVLVALFILAVMAATTMQVVSSATDVRLASHEKALAQLCADNLLAEQLLISDWPNLGRRDGSSPQGDAECFWRLEVEATPLPRMRRLKIEVFASSKRERSLTKLSGFVGK